MAGCRHCDAGSPRHSRELRGHDDCAGDQAVAPLVVAADADQQSAAGLRVQGFGGRGTVRQHSPGLGEQLIDGLGGTASGHVVLQIG